MPEDFINGLLMIHLYICPRTHQEGCVLLSSPRSGEHRQVLYSDACVPEISEAEIFRFLSQSCVWQMNVSECEFRTALLYLLYFSRDDMHAVLP